MSFDPSQHNRATDGRFTEKTGGSPEVSLDSSDEQWDSLAFSEDSGVKWNDDGQRSERRSGFTTLTEYAEERERLAKAETSPTEAAALRREAYRAHRAARNAELREKTEVPLKNPFKVGDQLTIPAGTLVYEKDSYGGARGTMKTERKRSAKAISSFDGYYAHVPHARTITHADGERRHLLNDLVVSHPYVEWWGRKNVNRVYLTPGFLEANGKAVEYDEDQFDKHSDEIASGGFGVERITKS